MPPHDPFAIYTKFVACPTTGCWLWTDHTTDDGYGRINVRTVKHLAHRRMYELEVGLIPYGMEIDHKCRVRSCVNPAHLEPVTHKENIRRGAATLPWVCAKGHREIETCGGCGQKRRSPRREGVK